MFIAGVDMAAEAAGTAMTLLDWNDTGAKVLEVRLGVDDAQIVQLGFSVEKLGVDCALGWPRDFVSFMTATQASAEFAGPFSGDIEFRRQLAYRETDRHVRQITGRWPLSVSTDRLAMTAIRTAGILSQLSAQGKSTPRGGGGLVVEVYPAATLRLWKLAARGYRASAGLRDELLSHISERVNWLDFEEHRELLVESCDAFDSLIAALATRAAVLGHTHQPAPEQLELANLEGWIALPTCDLEQLHTDASA